MVLATLGPARAQQAIKEALAKGADRALHLDDPAFATLDAFGIARALGKAIEKEKPDIVLTGLQSDDFGAAQTGVVLAEFLGLPHSTIIMEIQAEGGALRVKRELEGGWFQWISLPLPAVITIQSGINKPRYATLKGIMAAKKKPVKKLTAADLGLTAEDLAPRQRIAKVYTPVKAAQTEFLHPVLVELQIANDDVVAALDVEVAMFDGRAVGGENGQPALGLDVNQTLTHGQEHRVQQRRGVRAERADGLHRRADLIPTQAQIVHDLDDLDRASGLVGGLEGIGKIEWV